MHSFELIDYLLIRIDYLHIIIYSDIFLIKILKKFDFLCNQIGNLIAW